MRGGPAFRSTVRETLGVVAIRVAAAGIGFATNLVLGRLAGADGAGLYFLALAVGSVGAILGRLGLDNVVVRLGAVASARDDWPTIRRLHRRATLLVAAASCVVAVAVFVGSGVLSRWISPGADLGAGLRIMALGIVPQAVLFLQGEMFRALGRVRTAISLQLLAVPAVSLPLFLVLIPAHGASGAIAANVLAGLAALAVAALLWRTTTDGGTGPEAGASFAVLLRGGFPLLVVAAANLLMLWTDLFLLGMLGTIDDVGVYGVVSRTALLTTFTVVAVNAVAGPRFALLFERGDLAGLESQARRAGLVAALLAVPWVTLLVAAPESVLRLFGEGFARGGVALAILAVGQFLNVATGCVGNVLMMTGHEKVLRNVVVVAAVVNVILNWMLIRRFGIVGAAVATSLGLLLKNGAAAVLVHRSLGITVLPVPAGRRSHGA